MERQGFSTRIIHTEYAKKDAHNALQMPIYSNAAFEFDTAEQMEDAFLVYACTNISGLNRRIKTDGETLGILTNVVDNPGLCDFVSPAIYKHEHITVAVSSNAQEVRRAIAIRDKIKENLENDKEIFVR